MRTIEGLLAAAQLLLISPALLFMGALAVRNLQSLQYQPSRTAQRIVVWYAARQWTLWALLIALPFTVLIIGCCSLLRGRSDRVQRLQPGEQTLAPTHLRLAMPLIAATTLTAGAILAIVALHMLAN